MSSAASLKHASKGSVWLHSGNPQPNSEHRWPWQGICSPSGSTREIFNYEQWRSVMGDIRKDLQNHPGPPGSPRWVGLITYEAGCILEPAIPALTEGSKKPLARFWRYENPPHSLPPEEMPLPKASAWATPDEEEHRSRIEKCRQRIASGEIYQANLSRRIHLKFSTAPDGLKLTQALQAREQHSYTAWLKVDDDQEIISLTPEALLRGKVGQTGVASFPIKGTAEPWSETLKSDPKELAEHTMIVDLVRNDLGRVAEYGSVYVNPMLGTRDLRTLRHVESGVRATLKNGSDVLDALESLLPGGSITGAPKIRAMQIISEFEQTARGPYGGCVGYFSFNGNLDCCITIRTALLKDGHAHVQAGGGWVNDSVPENEFQETVNKAKAMLKAVALAEHGM